MTLYLFNTFKKRNIKHCQEDITYTFRYLISSQVIPSHKTTICNEMIEILKENKDIISVFKKAMRIKTTLMSQNGMLNEGMQLRFHLLRLGMSIAEDDSELINSEAFIDMSNNFYLDCKERYE